MMEYRIEKDSMGEIKVPKHHFWGAQTQRSLENFAIGTEKMPVEIIQAFALLKKAAALTNHSLDVLAQEKADLIVSVCDEILQEQWMEEFPLAVWQTGSGTQSNMNVNEVIAHIGNQRVGAPLLHPNDDVNRSQSSNDTFPTAMHIAAVLSIEERLFPAIDCLHDTFVKLANEHQTLIKSGRTHLQDATPITFGQEVSGWAEMLSQTKQMIRQSLDSLYLLALGGTAVGTGLNAPKGFDYLVASTLERLTGKPFKTSPNKFHALTSKDALVFAHGGLKALAANAMKIANDIRWLASGPRCGLGEIFIPENEPGSSIMPGKVNPTQAEALTMVAVQVMANDVAVGMAASQGNFQLNVFMPVCIYNFLQSVRLLSDALVSFNDHCAVGIVPNYPKMEENLHRSLMLVTCLNPYIGYEKAANTAKKAYKEQLSLKEACLALGYLSEEEFDRVFQPEKMI